MLQPVAPPESSSSEVVLPRSRSKLPVVYSTRWYVVLVESVVSSGAAKDTVPAETVEGTVRSASFAFGFPSVLEDHSSARTVARWAEFRVAPATASMLFSV